MERIGQGMLLVGLLIALGASVPFLLSVVANVAQPYDIPSQLIGPGWILGAIVGFIGLIVTAFGGNGFTTPQRRSA
jgi:hypothetical protein